MMACLIMLLLPLTRPEGLIFAFPLAAAIVVKEERCTLDLFLVINAGLLYFSWRYGYFGHLLPNTIYQKAHQPFGLMQSVYNVLEARYYLLALLVLCMTIKDGVFDIASRSVLIVYLLAYVFTNLESNFADRFFIQIFLPLFVFAAGFVKTNRLTVQEIGRE